MRGMPLKLANRRHSDNDVCGMTRVLVRALRHNLIDLRALHRILALLDFA